MIEREKIPKDNSKKQRKQLQKTVIRKKLH